MGWLSSFVNNPVQTLDDTRDDVESAWDTTRGVADDVWDYTKQAHEDAGKLVRDTGENTLRPDNLQKLFTDPLEWYRGAHEPLFGGDQGQPGFWDKYGMWLNAIPGGQALYLAGQAYNTGHDYERTGNEEQLRGNLAGLGAGYVAGQYIGPYTYGATEGVLGNVGAGALAGASSGAFTGAATGGINDEDAITRGAIIGGVAGGASSGFGDSYPALDDQGRPAIGYNDPVAGQSAGFIGGTAPSMYFAAEDRRELEQKMREYAEQAYNNYTQYRNTGESNQYQFPELQQELVGTPTGETLGGLFEEKTDQKRTTVGGNQLASNNSQISSGSMSEQDVQSGFYL